MKTQEEIMEIAVEILYHNEQAERTKQAKVALKEISVEQLPDLILAMARLEQLGDKS